MTGTARLCMLDRVTINSVHYMKVGGNFIF